jgi:hypothetical protein
VAGSSLAGALPIFFRNAVDCQACQLECEEAYLERDSPVKATGSGTTMATRWSLSESPCTYICATMGDSASVFSTFSSATYSPCESLSRFFLRSISHY